MCLILHVVPAMKLAFLRGDRASPDPPPASCLPHSSAFGMHRQYSVSVARTKLDNLHVSGPRARRTRDELGGECFARRYLTRA
ncbi:hypothetical protein BV898_16634 [Hypsibius exemplaris]|uniref:Uncharacterized protein n=1 Tax=Hypsibius exemplaris TaxID=2072580 RepID=A0A9X6RLP3_HYPEX|nr:hypothetical protein BV898_16634 [Hypsibius exemplaris]